MKTLKIFLIGLCLISSLVNCTSMRIEADKEPAATTQESKAYYFLWGIVPAKNSRPAEEFCGPGKWGATTMEFSALDIAISVVSAGLFISQSVTTECR